MPLTRKMEQLVGDLAMLEDPHERLALVVDRSKKLPPLPPEDRVDANRVHGCVSVVWLIGGLHDGCCFFRSDAESPVVRALVALLCDFFSGFAPALIVASDVDPLAALGLTQNLSPTRRNGLAAARRAIHDFARANLKS